MMIFVQRDLMMRFRAYRDCSMYDWITMTFRILICDGNKHYYQPVINHQTKFWKVCVSENCKLLFISKQLWHNIIKKLLEKEENEIIID